MKFCSRCGKEIMDEAVICVHCGCQAAPNSTYEHTDEYSKVKLYESKVNVAHTLSIIALILCLGVGIVFSIIGFIYFFSNQLQTPPKLINPSNADNLALEMVVAKKNRAGQFLAIPIIVLGLLIMVGSLLVYFA